MLPIPRLLPFVATLFLSLPVPVLAQMQEFRFERTSLGPGMSQPLIKCMLQDHLGYLWLGTRDGLYRYDGNELVTFRNDPARVDSLPDNDVLVLFEDSQGRLWLGTRKSGLSYYDPDLGSFRKYVHEEGQPQSLSNNQVRAIFEDNDGLLWIGTWGGGLNRFDPNLGVRVAHYAMDENDTSSLSHDWVCTLFEDRAGNLWVGTRSGLNKCDPRNPGVFERFLKEGPTKKSIWAIHEDLDGILWLGTLREGLIKFDPSGKILAEYPFDPKNLNGLCDRWVSDIHEGPSGSLWIGTGRGLNRFNPVTGLFAQYYRKKGDPTSLSDNSISTIYEDRGGVLWFGTHGGLNKLIREASSFQYLNLEALQEGDWQSHGSVTAICEDQQGALWLGSFKGLFKTGPTGELLAHYRHEEENPQSLVGNFVNIVYSDRDENLWIGTNSGLSHLEPGSGRFTNFKPEVVGPASKSISHSVIHAILQDSRSYLWFGSGQGLSRYVPERNYFDHYTHRPEDPQSISSNYVMALHEDRHGYLWVGTSNGLSHFNSAQGTFVTYRHDINNPNSPSHDTIHSIEEDRDGHLWLGTPAGLNKMQWDGTGYRFKHFRERDGLASDKVHGILEDENGFLWLGTNRGLTRFNPRTETFRNYDQRDGLEAAVFNSGAVCKGRDGKLFFGGINGMNAFYSDQILDNPQAPAVVLTDFRIFNQSVLPRSQDPNSPLPRNLDKVQRLTLGNKDKVISFKFAALDYAAPGKNRYAYQLEGLDDDWIYTDASNRFATYTTLPPGSYRFRVKGSNKDGIWNEQGRSLQIQVLPPFWRSWWAYGFYMLVLGTCLWLFLRAHRQKLNRERAVSEHLRNVDKLKDDFLVHTSRELCTPLQDVVGLAEAMLEGAAGTLPQNISTNLELINTSGKRMVGLVNDIRESAKLKHGELFLRKKSLDLRTLTDVVLNRGHSLIKGKAIQLLNAVTVDAPRVVADEDRLQQIMLNLVNNAIAFTASGTVTISARVEDDQMIVKVADTGMGIPAIQLQSIFSPFVQPTEPNFPGTRLDLTVAKQLVELHDGRIWVESTLGKGSSFYFTLSINTAKVMEASLESAAATQRSQPFDLGIPAPFQADPDSEGAFHILVVDDEPVNRRVMTQYLGLDHYRVSESSGGREALQRLEEGQTFDLVLLDIMMPDMSGFQVCRSIRERYEIQELPVIFLTTRDQTTDLMGGFQAGANDYLIKPIYKNELLARVKTHLELLDIHRTMDRKVAEKTRSLKEIEQLKTRFFTNLSHEFRTPLSLIIGPLEDILAQQNKPETNLNGHHQRMLVQARRMADLIDQLLDIARLDERKLKLNPSTSDLVAFVRDCASAFSPLAERKKITLQFRAEVDRLPVPFDSGQLEKVLYNLISNALKFTPCDGKIAILVMREGSWASISVKDTGRGIPAGQLPLVFDRFYQMEDSGSDLGTGIGLALAKELVSLHGGEIWVQSEVGFGSEFHFQIPLAGADASSPLKIVATQRLPQDMEDQSQWQEEFSSGLQRIAKPGEDFATILLVEDNPELRAFLREFLNRSYNVLEAGNGVQGLALVRERLPELVISDIMMPEMGGFELCQELKNDERTCHIPVLLLTAKAAPEDKMTGLALGADAYLQKPFNGKELLLRVANLIRLRRELQRQFCKQILLEPSRVAVTSMDEAFIQKILDAMERHYSSQNFDLEELAIEVGFSSRQLRRKLKALTGKGPAHFFRELRLKRAAQLLEQQAGNVEEVARMVGYRDPRHFAEVFREAFGQLPSHYARQQGKPGVLPLSERVI